MAADVGPRLNAARDLRAVTPVVVGVEHVVGIATVIVRKEAKVSVVDRRVAQHRATRQPRPVTTPILPLLCTMTCATRL